MKKLLIRSLLLCGALCGGAHAAPTLIVAGGKLTGASGVEVNGLLYSVEFRQGTCRDVFSGCDSLTDFAFSTIDAANAASQALLDLVFLDGAGGAGDDFDSNPALIEGCDDASRCDVLTPYDTDDGTGVEAGNAANKGGIGGGADFILGSRFPSDWHIDDRSIDGTWAVWKTNAVALEAPSTAALSLGVALAGFARSRRRNRS